MLLQTGKVRNYQNTDQGNQVQLTYVCDHSFFKAPFAPENNNYVCTNKIRMNNMYVISKMLIKEIKYN